MFVFSALFFALLVLSSLATAAVVRQFRGSLSQTIFPLDEPSPPSQQVARFLFRAGTLVDANTAALRLCSETPTERFDWEALRNKLPASFPDFP